MTVKDDENLFKSAKFVYIFSKYLGYLSYQYKERPGERLKPSNFHLVTWTIIQTASFSLQIYFGFSQIFNQYAFLPLMEYCFFIMYYLVLLINLFVAQIASKIYNGRFLEILNRLMEIEKNLEIKWKMHFNRIHLNILAWSLIIGTVVYLSLTIFVAVTYKIISLEMELCIVVLFFAMYSSQTVPTILFCTTLCVFKEILEQINGDLQKKIVRNVAGDFVAYKKEFVKDISSTCQEIFKGVRDLRQIFGLTILCMSGITFSIIVCHLYALASVKYFNVSVTNLILFTWLMLLGFSVVIVSVYVIICELYAGKVS